MNSTDRATWGALRNSFPGALFGCLLLLLVGCGKTPTYPVHGELLGEEIRTTVDSEIAQYYLERFLPGQRGNPIYDQRIDELYERFKPCLPTREELQDISASFSVDFAALFFADRLWAIPGNRRLQQTFERFLAEGRAGDSDLQPHFASYSILFVPGWDYVDHGHETGADFASPRRLVTNLGIENDLVPLPSQGSVEENASVLSREILARRESGKRIILVGASSAGPAVHLSLGEQLDRAQRRDVKAWINLGGLLQGTPLIDFAYGWPQRVLFYIGLWVHDVDEDALLSMSANVSRARYKRLALDENLLVINYVGLSLSGQLSAYSQETYPWLATDGPNDGLTLLADALAPNSLTLVAVGSDHFLANDPRIDDKTVALTKTVIWYLENMTTSQPVQPCVPQKEC